MWYISFIEKVTILAKNSIKSGLRHYVKQKWMKNFQLYFFRTIASIGIMNKILYVVQSWKSEITNLDVTIRRSRHLYFWFWFLTIDSTIDIKIKLACNPFFNNRYKILPMFELMSLHYQKHKIIKTYSSQ